MCRMLPANPATDNSGAARDNRDNPHPPTATMLISMPERVSEGNAPQPRSTEANGAMNRISPDYTVDPLLVADALIKRLDRLADERAEYRRALIHSVEVIKPGDFDDAAGLVH